MKNRNIIFTSILVAGMFFTSCELNDAKDFIPVEDNDQTDDDNDDESLALQEANILLESIEEDGGEPFDEEDPELTFKADENVFMPSVLGLDFRIDRNAAPEGPTVRLPLFKGWETTAEGLRETHYIITESSDKAQAKRLGIIFSPRMANATEGRGTQKGKWTKDGRLIFEGSVDFSPKRSLTPGGLSEDGLLFGFPPAAVTPGAVADENWSSYVVLPSGTVINAQLMANSTGIHDRVPHGNGTPSENQDNQNNPNIDRDGAAIVLQILDGWQNGKPYYFHIVTDTSDPGPATIELGVFAPKLNDIPTFGAFPGGAMLPFSPTANGVSAESNNPDGFQGLNTASLSNRQENDPTNTFPIDPSDDRYSPMWDAHVTEFTVPADQRVILKSFEQVNNLLADGTLIPFRGNNPDLPSQNNSLSSALTPTGAIINCPVIAQPYESAIGRIIGEPTND